MDRLAEAMAQPPPCPRRCAGPGGTRGCAEDADAFLAPSLRDLLPDPHDLRDMEKAAARFLEAVKARERIAIFADYDVDGGTSAALLIWLAARHGLAATLYIPDRIDEGYGPNDAAMAALAADHDLIICVDCGTLSHGPIAAAVGADVIVLDHHLGGETSARCCRRGEPEPARRSGELGHLCAAGVVFLMLVEANRQMKSEGARGPDLMSAARFGGPWHRRRCGPVDRREPRLCAPRAHRHGPQAAHRDHRPFGRRGHE